MISIHNQHVIDWIEQQGSQMVNKFIKGKCSGFAYGVKLNKYNNLKQAEYNLIASFTGEIGADFIPQFDGLGRER